MRKSIIAPNREWLILRYTHLMKSVAYIFVLSLLFAACQQSRLLNLRNLTLVEGEENELYEEPVNDDVILDFDQEPTLFEPQTVLENRIEPEFNTEPNALEEIAYNSGEADFIEEFNESPNEIIDPNNIYSPPILSDSTKTESEKPSKEVSGKILWVFGSLSLIAIILFTALFAFGIFIIILFLSIVFGHFFE